MLISISSVRKKSNSHQVEQSNRLLIQALIKPTLLIAKSISTTRAQNPVHSLRAPSSIPPLIPPPLGKLETPSTGHQHAGYHIHEPDKQTRYTGPLFRDREQYGFNIVFHKHTRDHVLCHRMALLCHGVLIREDRVLRVLQAVLLDSVGAGGGRLGVLVDFTQRFGVGGVDCRHHGEVVLVFVEVGGGGCVGVVEGVGEGGVEGAKGEFVDYVAEVEGCWSISNAPQ